MRNQFLRLAVGLVVAGLAACSGQSGESNGGAAPAKPADTTPAPAEAAKKSPPPAESAQSAMVQKAEGLTRDQIKASKDPNALSKLAQLYDSQHDAERFSWVLERLTELLPNSGNLKLQLAMAYAGFGDKSKTYDVLVHMADQGFYYEIEKDPRFEQVHDTKVWDYIVANLRNNGKPYGEGKVAFSLPKGDNLFESIAWDPTGKTFLVGSVREGKIYRVDQTGKLREFIAPTAENGLWAVYGVAVDATHDKLYAISNGVPHFKGFNADIAGKTGLFEFSLSTGKFQRKYSLPDDGKAHILSSIALNPKAGVFVADGVNQQIFRIDNGELKLVVGNPVLSGVRGMAINDDGSTLYFSDVALGIFGLDLATGKPFNLGFNPAKLVLGGIDSLTWYQGSLIVLQNTMEPERVMRLKLAEDGRSVASAMPLDVAQTAFDVAVGGTISGDGYYFIANSEKSLYDGYGVLTASDKLEPVRIFRSNARFAWDQKGIPAAVAAEAKRVRNQPPAALRRPDADPPAATATQH